MAKVLTPLAAFFLGGLLSLWWFSPLHSAFPREWEYRVVMVKLFELGENQEYRRLLRKYRDPVKAQMAFLETLCNRLGRQGFELVQYDLFGKRSNFLRLVFKRRR